METCSYRGTTDGMTSVKKNVWTVNPCTAGGYFFTSKKKFFAFISFLKKNEYAVRIEKNTRNLIDRFVLVLCVIRHCNGTEKALLSADKYSVQDVLFG